MKKLIVMGVGIVVLIITAGIAYQNYAYAKLAKEEVNALKVTVQQKDMEIAKLNKDIKAKQDELNSIKVELNDANKALNDARDSISKVIPLPAAPVAQTVNK